MTVSKTLQGPSIPERTARPAPVPLRRRTEGTSTGRGRDERPGTRPSGGAPGRALHGGGDAAGLAPVVVRETLRSPGRPLDSGIREYLEPRFGQDFSRVRVHADSRAAESARAVRAAAYTVGDHIVFAEGRYRPGEGHGVRVLAHELAHVAQSGPAPRTGDDIPIGREDDPAEKLARDTADLVTRPGSTTPTPSSRLGRAVLRRFSESEHRRIGDAAYTRAFDETRSGPATASRAPVDPDLVAELRQLRFQPGRTAYGYGEMVAIADNIASFDLLEQQQVDRRSGIPILGPVWDFLGDSAHYLDLAARNTAHFHPHNYLTWQPWHWRALQVMEQAHQTGERAADLRSEVRDLLRRFRAARLRARRLLDAEEARPGAAGGPTEASLQRALDEMQALLSRAERTQARYRALRGEAGRLAVRAMAMNGFADHFLTDAFAAGHIVTPRQELLTEYSTRFLGVVPVGGVLQCANVPSLAWHDLDNMLGVEVDNVQGARWRTYGDDYADEDRAPGGRTLSPTMEHVVAATTESIRQMWRAAKGSRVSSLRPVLDQLPRPVLDRYPSWQGREWELQLRHAAGEQLGASVDPMSSSPRGIGSPEVAPNPRGNQVGSGLLSARATCLDLLQRFTYRGFVLPTVERIKRNYRSRYFVGAPGQVVPATAPASPQASVTGYVVAGSLIGLGAGLLGAGLLGAGVLLGGLLVAGGFLVGGLVGGLFGRRRDVAG
ncbi:uncharacterized protein DUF4157 [Blastococcus colisei]|uniref:Uncharacterized protein DUF4157 n=1 Tax=Blastococcus colisei TaxID=1564162 RepID=A0A543PFS1_9ACTN|nr:DUF4157 domain-containing protein [Blastococcus colisei]TQN42896.1 uncharacterized protein DUF4157 [Blastococcus colisei]